jgi:hypothetical protein
VTNNRKSNDLTNSKPQSAQKNTNMTAAVKPTPRPIIRNTIETKSSAVKVPSAVQPPPTRGRSTTRRSTQPIPFAFATDARMVKRCSSRESETPTPSLSSKVETPSANRRAVDYFTFAQNLRQYDNRQVTIIFLTIIPSFCLLMS